MPRERKKRGNRCGKCVGVANELPAASREKFFGHFLADELLMVKGGEGGEKR